MKDLKERAKTCEGCLGWLDVCKGECCKVFVINNIKRPRFYKGMILQVPMRLTEDAKFYFRIHGCEVGENWIRFRLNNFERQGNKLFVYNRCQHHNEDFTCEIYEKRPEVCRALDNTTKHEKRFYLTPRCLFKHKEDD